VLRISFRRPAVRLSDERIFETMVRSMFTQRRKTLGNALRPFATSLGADPGRALMSAGIEPGRRPETLQLDELARLADILASR
jgi:16S rRNA (adenine1518-N6/adenine1519-N6)-dimethyltransferase